MTTSAAGNKQLVSEIFEELAKGNGKPFGEHLSEDCVWRAIGSTSWSGIFRGKADIEQRLLGPLRKRISGPIRTAAARIIADGEYVAVEARGENRTVEGRAYNNQYCFVLKLQDGMIREITEYMDTQLAAGVLSPPVAPEALQPVLAAVEVYFRGHASGDPNIMRAAFWPGACIAGVRNGVHSQWTVDEYCKLFSGQPAADESSRVRTVQSVEITAGHCALARVSLLHGSVRFFDLLALLKTGDEWRIANKTFTSY